MTTTPNPIDSLPATPETVGIPTIGDTVWCHRCECFSEVTKHEVDWREPGCWACGSYDVEKVKP